MRSPLPPAADTASQAAPGPRAHVRVAGHFGELLQGRLGPGGPVVLLTLPCPALSVTAHCSPGPFALDAPPDVLGEGRARALLRALDLQATGRVQVTAEMPPGGGAGASTGALVALARGLGGAGLDPQRLAAACVAVEGASDPAMRSDAGRLLWASRRGKAVDMLPPPPTLDVVGAFFGAGEATRGEDSAFPDVADLVARWAAGPLTAAEAAALASASARRTTALRGPADDRTEGLVAETGALGWVRAHTGSARGLLFAPGQAPEGVEAALAARGGTGLVRFRTGAG